jgi:ferric-dicitrate binding protein FerR (iron transport regulator)
MSDESSRSARPYGQRRNDGAPAWWAALDRADLPDNEAVPAAHRRWYEDAPPAAPRIALAGRAERAPVRRAWLTSLLVALAIALVLGIAWGVDSTTDQVLVVTLLIGIPVGLAAAVTIFIARRNG